MFSGLTLEVNSIYGGVMLLSSYRVYFAMTIDVTFSDESRAELALVHLIHKLDLAFITNPADYRSMIIIDQLSAYIANAFGMAYNRSKVLGEMDELLELPGIGDFKITESKAHWMCYREDFGSIYIQLRMPLGVSGINHL